MFRRTFLLLAAVVLTACSDSTPETPTHKDLETPTGEAVLRHMLELCPQRKDAKQLTIVLGELQHEASTEFENKFADTGLLITPSRKLVAGAVNGEVRIFDGSTNQAPIILQLTSLTPEATNPANFEAIAAWAYKDKAQRLRLRVLPGPDNKWDIRKIEEIPLPVRNQDGMPTPPGGEGKK